MARKVRPPSDEFEFVLEAVNRDYYCPVSLEVMMNPRQTDCCGSHISAGAAERLSTEGKPCPLCNAPSPGSHHRSGNPVFTSHRDQYFQRVILDQRVRCPHRRNGCEWVGPLREVQDHSASCSSRPWICQYCRYTTVYKIGTTEHAQLCPLRPVLCSCSSDHIPFNKLEEHKKICPVELVTCEFADVGCTVTMRRKNILDHLKNCVTQHHLLVSRKTLSATLAMQPSSSGLGPRVSLEGSSQQLKDKDAKILELRNSVTTLSADLNTARAELVRVHGELREKDSKEMKELLDELKKKNDTDLQVNRLKEQMRIQEEQLQSLQRREQRDFDAETTISNVAVMVTDVLENIRLKKSLGDKEIKTAVANLEEVMTSITERKILNGEDEVSLDGYIVPSSPLSFLKGKKEVVKFRGHLQKTLIKGLKRAWGLTAAGEDVYVIDTNGSHCLHIVNNGTVRHMIESASFSDVHIPLERCWYPRFVALDKEGSLFLADTGSHRILKFSSNGKLLAHAGRESTSGSTSDVFDCPMGIALDANENVYVCDRSNHRIQMLTSELQWVSSFGVKGSGHMEFCNPWDLAFDCEGNIYVADCGNRCVKVFTDAFSPLKTLGKSVGKKYKNGDLRAPTGVCVDGKGNVYVTDMGLKAVVVYNSAGEYTMSFGQFLEPYGICVDCRGYVYVSDNGGYSGMFSSSHPGRVQVFS